MEDSGIITLLLHRSEDALAELSNKYGGLCRSIARGILADPGAAEECENDVWLRVWDSIPPQRPTSLCAYVSRIARNLALDRLKALGRQKRGGEVDRLYTELSECIPAREDTAVSADDTAVRAIDRFLRGLDTQTRVLFIRRYFYLESAVSLAHRFGLTASNVSTRLNRARAKLRAQLELEGVNL